MNKNYLIKILRLYVDGFKNMRLGRKLWAIIIVKLIIMFGVLKLFLFDESLNSKFKTSDEKANFVLENLTKD
ncbi:DUF4492 domain-containing protein [Campylobacter gastrosuis]|uniref:DUF4492 domain-containing protein n=1 Tax=Campylobacter gastrosuis TaxID=2974576 RepID=A0ABT7HRA6_9BACT|nr:DUF4492 domain-containing protein [Campylobacter gastrosuis]MDL0089452.1 DUF4492 domain-containing protein [Campylobacter gastrosuis]